MNLLLTNTYSKKSYKAHIIYYLHNNLRDINHNSYFRKELIIYWGKLGTIPLLYIKGKEIDKPNTLIMYHNTVHQNN